MIEFYIIKKKNCFLTFFIFRQLPEKKTQKNAVFEVDSLLDDVAPVDGLYGQRCRSRSRSKSYIYICVCICE